MTSEGPIRSLGFSSSRGIAFYLMQFSMDYLPEQRSTLQVPVPEIQKSIYHLTSKTVCSSTCFQAMAIQLFYRHTFLSVMLAVYVTPKHMKGLSYFLEEKDAALFITKSTIILSSPDHGYAKETFMNEVWLLQLDSLNTQTD
ncbi:predicted protein [Sclerotinia sclerotiorum 1980 UF-70]|uniref:Uncharacterized protein n=1 Tax=Sclerotinia sclerotiorum (strain ATCC 18683 / 1980 / Ss-1) TaxID=665079 RepID=A7EK64_SCLS1|nr:predicted protein [Sclerotinia sclerotiorum 1980 UF-70]EDO03230.1 predicted protein [Sclerotinia sclerotiorum 1980 UF-70]